MKRVTILIDIQDFGDVVSVVATDTDASGVPLVMGGIHGKSLAEVRESMIGAIEREASCNHDG